MAQMTGRAVKQTRSGLMVRFDEGIGMLVYSPFNSLIFGVHPNYTQHTLEWLEMKREDPPTERFEKMIGAGWFIPHEKAQYEMPHLLPSKDCWQFLNPEWPIVINWLLTGRCPLACKYCDAEDLMRDNIKEPEEVDIENIAENILSYNPIAIVLTGGDPLFSPYIDKVIKILHGRAGIMVDTNAYCFNSRHLQLFRKYRVAVRISIDSEIPRINDELRPVHSSGKPVQKAHCSLNSGSLGPAMKALCQCLDEGITVSVQSVATKKTANDLPAFGDKLFRMGVRSWRIHKVVPSSSKMKEYKELIGGPRKEKQMYKHVFSELIKAYANRWRKKIALQLTHNVPPNAVILVAPDGRFFTESNVSVGKLILDEEHPFKPRMKELFRKINKDGHTDRYLNLSSANGVK
jgi:MoaA/NifB/PqqE/SkfB family radical SAM enzyme